MLRDRLSFEGGSRSSSQPEGGEGSSSRRFEGSKFSRTNESGSHHSKNAEQGSPWEIKRIELKDVKSCKHNIIEVNNIIEEEYNKKILVELQEAFDRIPYDLKDIFKKNIDIMVENLEKTYNASIRDYGHRRFDLLRCRDITIKRETGRGDMRKYPDKLDKERKKIKKDLKVLKPFQEARELCDEALNYVWPDCESCARKMADLKINSAMESYKQAVDQRDSGLAHAREGIKETTEWLKEKVGRLKHIVEKQINLQIEEITRALGLYDQCSEQFSEKLGQYKNEKQDGKLSVHELDQWRQVFEEIHGQVIDGLPNLPEGKNRLKEYPKFNFFYDSINEISDFQMNADRDILNLRGLYKDKINKLMEKSNNGTFEYLKKLLYWDEKSVKKVNDIDEIYKRLNDRVDDFWQSFKENYGG